MLIMFKNILFLSYKMYKICLPTFPRNPGELVSLADKQSKTQRYATGNLHIKEENGLNVQLLIKNYVDFKSVVVIMQLRKPGQS